MARYAMSNIHGQYLRFKEMLDKIKFSKEDELYILGDVVDRGPYPIHTLTYIMRQPNMHMVIGDHEQVMLEALATGDDTIWKRMGGEPTKAELSKLSKKNFVELMTYISKLPRVIELDKFILVHAGITPQKHLVPRKWQDYAPLQDQDNYICIQEEFFYKRCLTDKKVIFGHTPVYCIENGTHRTIWKDRRYRDKIGIDCGATFDDGLLGCLNLDTLEEHYT